MKLTLALGMVGLSAMLLACSSSDSESPAATGTTAAATPAAAASPVEATLTDFAIALSKDSAPAGLVTFAAKNDGATPHELVVIKSDLAPDALPVADGKVDEAAMDFIGEIEEFPVGESQTGAFELDAGKYILICNVAGHYQLGMHAAFTVE
ncbi:MAG: sulfocyanin-like copper-binding protein [Chloroflexi bacterium]|nr:sulfocyanin-like copper-binding protein [Chloroflexota bacterium]MDA1002067.1 sulfocyanin-like copper-binding protein [Chloroflexota bacterium]